jgi:hypothetical protein
LIVLVMATALAALAPGAASAVVAAPLSLVITNQGNANLMPGGMANFSGFAIGSGGALSAFTGSPFSLPGTPGTKFPYSAAFTPDGKLMFVGLYDGTGTFLSTEDWKPAGAGIRGHGQRILNARFTPDGQTLATSSADGTVQFWDVASHGSIGAPLVVQRNAFVASILSRDGSYLYALPTGTEGMRLALAPRLWSDLACAIAGRELTRREWDEVLPDRPYREVCAPA